MRDNSTFTYLEHEMSISQTASALYIQRSGLAKRLNTIHKLIPEDWAQLDTRLHDRLYFAMLRRGLVEKPFRQPEQFTLNYYLYFAGHFIFSAQAHMTQSDYVTACCLEKLIVILDGLKEVLRQQKAIGNNLNQLAVLANMGKVQFANLDSAAQETARNFWCCSGRRATAQPGRTAAKISLTPHRMGVNAVTISYT